MTEPTTASAMPASAAVETAAANKAGGRKKKTRRIVPRGLAHVHASYNNTIVAITDPQGNGLAWSSAGHLGFKGPKKATPYVAGLIVRDVVDKVRLVQMKEVDVQVRGIGSGREAAIRALHAQGLQILSIKDVTPVPHNGCRPRKVRRV